MFLLLIYRLSFFGALIVPLMGGSSPPKNRGLCYKKFIYEPNLTKLGINIFTSYSTSVPKIEKFPSAKREKKNSISKKNSLTIEVQNHFPGHICIRTRLTCYNGVQKIISQNKAKMPLYTKRFIATLSITPLQNLLPQEKRKLCTWQQFGRRHSLIRLCRTLHCRNPQLISQKKGWN